MAEQAHPELTHLLVHDAFPHKELVKRYGASWGARNKVWRVPVIAGHVIESTTGECREPDGFADHLRSLGCRVAFVRRQIGGR